MNNEFEINEFEFYAEEESFEFYPDNSIQNRLHTTCKKKELDSKYVVTGINEGVLGMTATKYKKLHSIKEPFNDNLTEDQVDMKNIGIALATLRIRNHVRETLTHKEGNHIGLTSGQRARKLAEESKD